LLITISVIGVFLIFYIHKRKSRQTTKITSSDEIPAYVPSSEEHKPEDSRRPVFSQKPSGTGMDLARMALIILSIIAGAGILLLALPQATFEGLAERIQARRKAPEQEKIALLYLGDELKNNEFRIQGILKNISAAPIEQLDAVVRLYAGDRALLETVITRLDKDTIAPGEFARMELKVPSGKMGFAGYAVEFKLRQGDILPFKNMRAQTLPK